MARLCNFAGESNVKTLASFCDFHESNIKCMKKINEAVKTLFAFLRFMIEQF